MSASSLKILTLSSFRGASTEFRLQFEKGKKLTLIYGENGTGKTTICDGLESLTTDKIGSLEGKGLGTSTKKYVPTVGKDSNDISVTLETYSETFSSKSQNNILNIVILRRNQLLAFIEAAAGERYKAIKEFIDIAAVETSEKTLKSLVKTLEDEQKSSLSKVNSAREHLDSMYNSLENRNENSALEWAEKILATPNHQYSSNIATIEKLRSAFQALEEISNKYQEHTKKLELADDAYRHAEKRVENAIEQAGSGANELLTLLKSGAKFLCDHPTTVECPLCGSSEKFQGLSARIQERLANFEELATANKKKNEAKKECEAQKNLLLDLNNTYQNKKTAWNTAQEGSACSSMIQLPGTPPPEKLADINNWLLTNATMPPTWKATMEKWQKEKNDFKLLEKTMVEYRSHSKKLDQINTHIEFVKKALTLLIEERQSFTDQIIKEIADKVGEIYEEVHPDEGLNKISMQLKTGQRASLDISSEFCQKTAPPQAYFSQSHLDTLGLCIFLALELRDKPSEKILIIDDVIGSMDEPHIERIIKVLYKYSAKFRHCIITTHYRPWKERYRWGWLKGAPCHFVELKKDWNLDRGLSTTKSLPEIDRLRRMLKDEDPDLQAICGKAGVILEAALDYLTQKYECRVHRRPRNEFTLGDLLPATNKLRKHLKAEIRDKKDENGSPVVVELGPILDELERIAQARNAFGAHFKDISFELLDADALGFAKQVVLLMEALTHPEDGWPGSDKSGSYWATSGDLRRLHPLKNPDK